LAAFIQLSIPYADASSNFSLRRAWFEVLTGLNYLAVLWEKIPCGWYVDTNNSEDLLLP